MGSGCIYEISRGRRRFTAAHVNARPRMMESVRAHHGRNGDMRGRFDLRCIHENSRALTCAAESNSNPFAGMARIDMRACKAFRYYRNTTFATTGR
jgi:hypothetical protein